MSSSPETEEADKPEFTIANFATDSESSQFSRENLNKGLLQLDASPINSMSRDIEGSFFPLLSNFVILLVISYDFHST